MFQSGEFVIYGVHGVCRVIGREKQLVNRKRTEFLVLEPVGSQASRFFLPAASETAMGKLQKVLSADELQHLLESQEIHNAVWIDDEGARKQYYRELIGSGDRSALMRMVGALYRYRESQFAAGKKFHLSDDNFLRDAERLLASEVSLVLGKTPEEAKNILREYLK